MQMIIRIQRSLHIRRPTVIRSAALWFFLFVARSRNHITKRSMQTKVRSEIKRYLQNWAVMPRESTNANTLTRSLVYFIRLVETESDDNTWSCIERVIKVQIRIVVLADHSVASLLTADDNTANASADILRRKRNLSAIESVLLEGHNRATHDGQTPRIWFVERQRGRK